MYFCYGLNVHPYLSLILPPHYYYVLCVVIILTSLANCKVKSLSTQITLMLHYTALLLLSSSCHNHHFISLRRTLFYSYYLL
jgi:hypothetical protein